jgi:DNA invertase Pin-like site-specific DNA recombinase
MLIGYARVSTPEQDLTPQLEALVSAGCERTFSDKASGAKADRAGLAQALSHARPGDMLVVWKLDRLGRTMKGLIDLSTDLAARGIGLRSITDGIDTAGTAGKLVFHIMAAMAEMERDLVRERTTAALLIAKRQGRGPQDLDDPEADRGGPQTARFGHDGARDRPDDRRVSRYALPAPSGTGTRRD